MTLAIEIIVTGIVLGAFYALVAVGLQITYAGTRVINFAQGDFVTAGAFAIWTFNVGLHLNIWLSFVAVCVVGYLLGLVFEILVVRAVATRPLIQSALATVAGSFILEGIYEAAYGPDTRSVPSFINAGPIRAGDVTVPTQDVISLAIVLLLGSAFFILLSRTRAGLIIRATAASREGGMVVGVKISRVSSLVFGLSGLTSAAAGAVIAPITGANFLSGQNVLLIAFTAAVLGGLNSTVSAATGGLVLGLVLSGVAASSFSNYTQTSLLVVLLLVVLIRPNGIFVRRPHAA